MHAIRKNWILCSHGYQTHPLPRFVSNKKLERGSCLLQTEEARHALTVLRLMEGSHIQLCDGMGSTGVGVITHADRKRKSLTVCLEEEPVWEPEPLPKILLCVACGSLKGGRGDWLVEKATELGATSFIPLLTERSPMLGTGKRENERLQRWTRLSTAAAKQCLRIHFMKIEAPMELGHMDKIIDSRLALLATNDGMNVYKWINSSLSSIHSNRKDIVLLIGPEGDFSETEKQSLKNLGSVPVSLGRNRLRVETASIALLSFMHTTFQI